MMFKDAEILTTATLPDNEVVIKYIEENLDGVIPDSYRDVSGSRIRFENPEETVSETEIAENSSTETETEAE